MRTTIRLNDALMERVKRRAAEEGTTFTSLVEEGLRLALARRAKQEQEPERVPVPVSSAEGGVRPGVDLNSNAALLALLDEDDRWS